MKIFTVPDPVLRETCTPVEIGDKKVKKLAKQMLREMYRSDGVGLAAPQIGMLKRMVVIDCEWGREDDEGRPAPKNGLVLINPEIIDHSEETYLGPEGCLSCPGIQVEVERFSHVTVRCFDEDFNEVIYEAGEELFGRCMQHEIDHLDGKTLFDKIDPIARIEVMKEYERALEAGARPGDC